MDNLYQEAKGLSKAAVSSTKGAVSNTRKSWKMLKRSTARIKALSRKRFTAGAGNKFNQQMYRYMRSAAYQSVSTGGGIINTAKNVLSYAYWSVRMAANGVYVPRVFVPKEAGGDNPMDNVVGVIAEEDCAYYGVPACVLIG